jgi:peptidoglycan/LPS O-acetylase OafA/YrhL
MVLILSRNKTFLAPPEQGCSKLAARLSPPLIEQFKSKISSVFRPIATPPMTSNNQQQATNKPSSYLNKAELVMAPFILIALVFKILHWPGAGIMLTVSLSALSVMYFFSAYAQQTNPQLRKMDVFFSKIMFWGVCVGAIGLLFVLQKWPGGDRMTILCSLTSVASIVYVVKVKKERPEEVVFSNRALVRLILFALLCSIAATNAI